jgi:hypothetical protein
MTKPEYMRQVLNAYRQTPTTAGRITRQDRLLAAELYDRGVPLRVVENALILGAARRLYRRLDAPPLAPVRSLHYFRGLIEEIASLPLKYPQAYFDHLRLGIDTFEQRKQAFLKSRQTRTA